MKGRERFGKRLQPALSAVLAPGEAVRASWFAMVIASHGMHALVGAATALMSKFYWLAVTDRRFIVLSDPGPRHLDLHPVITGTFRCE